MRPNDHSKVRKPSPTQGENEERTFREKISEIRKLRESGLLGKNQRKVDSTSTKPVRPLKKFIINGKPAEKLLGDWALMKSSKGKLYYFNLKTMVSESKRGSKDIDT